jgi:hypothetical protein
MFTDGLKWLSLVEEAEKDKALLLVVLVFDLYAPQTFDAIRTMIEDRWYQTYAYSVKIKKKEGTTSKQYPYQIIGLIGNNSTAEEAKEPIHHNEIDGFSAKKLFGVPFMRNHFHQSMSEEVVKRILQRFLEYLGMCWRKENAQLPDEPKAQ